MRFTAALFSLLVLAGCVTLEEKKAKYAQEMDSFIGRNADDLVVAKGPPSNSSTLSELPWYISPFFKGASDH